MALNSSNGSFVANGKEDFSSRKGQAWAACNKLNYIWKSDIAKSTKIKFFRACVESILLLTLLLNGGQFIILLSKCKLANQVSIPYITSELKRILALK